MKLEDTIFIGQEIIVPADKTDNEDDVEDINKKQSENTNKSKNRGKHPTFYTVKKGDTLFIVAKRHATNLEELLKINNMKITDKLLYGQKIKIP